ncbi:MAG TPA: haloalkane dehalogenase [Candidatus Anoxymicrobiaceae bacterium]
MRALRTPDERFSDLPSYPFEPHYLDVPDCEGGHLRIHFVDEGPAGGEPVLLMHGEPSWSFLYRKMIPVFVEAGFRAIAPDLVGFGRSDKPADRRDYTYERHVSWMRSFLDGLGARDINLVCQDWGGLIGLRLVAGDPDAFARVIASNTGLPTGDQKLSDAFTAWRDYSQQVPDFNVGQIVQGGCKTELPPEVVAAYDAPFPEDAFKEGPRIFPSLVPISGDDPSAEANRRAWESLARFDKAFLTAFSDGDPITRGGERVFQKLVPGTKGQPHVTIAGAGHFVQEDKGEEFARIAVDFIRTTTHD